MGESDTGQRAVLTIILGSLGILAAWVLLVFAVGVFDPAVRAAWSAMLIGAARWLLIGLAGLVVVAIAGGLAWAVGRWRRAQLIYPDRRTGLFPVVPGGWNLQKLGEPSGRAEIAAAAFCNVERMPVAVGRQLLAPPDAPPALPGPEPALQLTAGEAVDVDPVTRPHWLVVGQTGSGKSTATRYIMQELASRYRCEFVICEPGGIDWNTDAAAYTEAGIAGAIRAVYGEFERRQDLLRRADLTHVSQLPDGLPYVYLVVEEFEAVLDDLRLLDRGAAVDAQKNLRQIARMGRKPGIGLIAVTQAARADVFDSHVRTNLANVLLFRNSQNTAEMFRVGGAVNLAGLPVGSAYSLAHGRTVTFPMIGRPTVPLSGLYREGGSQAVREPVQAVVQEVVHAEKAGFGPFVDEPVREPEDRTAGIYRAYLATARTSRNRRPSLNATVRVLYGEDYKGGEGFRDVRDAVLAQLRRRGLPVPWERNGEDTEEGG